MIYIYRFNNIVYWLFFREVQCGGIMHCTTPRILEDALLCIFVY